MPSTVKANESTTTFSKLRDVASSTVQETEITVEYRSPNELNAFNWAFFVLAIVLASHHLYLGLFAAFVPGERATQFVIIGLALLFGPIIYFTPYWRPLLYLLGVGFAGYLGALWMFGGMEYFAFGVIAGITPTSFILLGLYLFYREEAQAIG